MAMDLSKATSWSGNALVGTMVIVLYVFFVFAVFSGFASYIYRTDWKASVQTVQREDGSQQVYDLDNIYFLLQRETKLRTELEAALKQVRDADQVIDDANDQLEGMPALKRNIENDVAILSGRVISFVRSDIDSFDEQTRQKVIAVFSDGNLATDVKAFELAMLYQARIGLTDATLGPSEGPGGHAGFINMVDSLRIADDELTRIEAAERALQSRRDRSLEARSWPRKRSEMLAADLRELDEIIPSHSGQRARIVLLSDMFLGIPAQLVSFPTIFLTLIVTIAAGGLGTVVSFSRKFFSATGPVSASKLFVNVGEGIAAALGIFLFSGAGMLVLTQGGGSAAQVELSPFTVAFIAFVSGFMAEDAFGSIQAAGRRIFSGEAAAPDDLAPKASRL